MTPLHYSKICELVKVYQVNTRLTTLSSLGMLDVNSTVLAFKEYVYPHHMNDPKNLVSVLKS